MTLAAITAASDAPTLDEIFDNARAALAFPERRRVFIDAVAQWAFEACGEDGRLGEEAAERLIRRIESASLDSRLVVDALTAVLERIPGSPSTLVRFALRYANEALAIRDYSSAALARVGLSGRRYEPRAARVG
jgi:hypothetical protein